MSRTAIPSLTKSDIRPYKLPSLPADRLLLVLGLLGPHRPSMSVLVPALLRLPGKGLRTAPGQARQGGKARHHSAPHTSIYQPPQQPRFAPRPRVPIAGCDDVLNELSRYKMYCRLSHHISSCAYPCCSPEAVMPHASVRASCPQRMLRPTSPGTYRTPNPCPKHTWHLGHSPCKLSISARNTQLAQACHS